MVSRESDGKNANIICEKRLSKIDDDNLRLSDQLYVGKFLFLNGMRLRPLEQYVADNNSILVPINWNENLIC